MNDSITPSFEKQLNIDDLLAMLNKYLASWDLVVFPVGSKFVIGEVKGGFYIEELLKRENIIAAYEAALELVPDILFAALTDEAVTYE